MNKKVQNILIATAAFIGGITAIVIIRKGQRNKLTKEISNQIKDETTIQGNVDDMYSTDFFSPVLTYKVQYKVATAREMAKKLYDMFGYMNTDEQGIISFVRSIPNKNAVLNVFDYFVKEYGSLKERIERDFNKEEKTELYAVLKAKK
jgi:hypothetical protein